MSVKPTGLTVNDLWIDTYVGLISQNVRIGSFRAVLHLGATSSASIESIPDKSES